ncbi:hypothetical protein OY671_006127 [Metschnikowia pulcherrima]|nr:hypothetical protein OY671_006127 [Metschnikowia pulcherrima]
MTDTFPAFDLSPVPVPGPDAVAPEPFRGIYGMPQFVTVPTDDLAASVELWTRGLGFFDSFSVPGGMVHSRRWAFQDVLLVPGTPAPDSPASTVSFSCVSSQVDAIVAACEAVTPGCTTGPREMPWGSVEVEVRTPENARVVMTAARPFVAGSDPARTAAPRWTSGHVTTDPTPGRVAHPSTVGDAAAAAGVTVRTSHHWDAVGLVRPSARTPAGYRLYAAADVARSRRVVAYRESGVALEDVPPLLDATGAEAVDASRRHRASLGERIARMERTARASDRLVAARERGLSLTPTEQVASFGEGWDPAWPGQARELWGDTAQWAQYAERSAERTPEDWQRSADDVAASEADLAAACRAGVDPASPRAATLAERHRASMGAHFDCPPARHVCLARRFVDDAGFRAHYDGLAPGSAAWLRAAVEANARSRGGHGGRARATDTSGARRRARREAPPRALPADGRASATPGCEAVIPAAAPPSQEHRMPATPAPTAGTSLAAPARGAILAGDAVRAGAALSVVVAGATLDGVGVASFSLVLGGTMVPRALGVTGVLDVGYGAASLASAWAAQLEWYRAVPWLDSPVHAVCTGSIAALATVTLVRVGASPAPHADARPWRTGVVVVTTGLGAVLAISWELGEWAGHTFLDDRIGVGYGDTVTDLATGSLGSVVAGTVAPLEVVVVDNASRDDSALVARRWGAVVVREERVGIPAAAATGYDAARGDVIARLDADSLPDPGWVQRVVDRMAADPTLDAMTGTGTFDDSPRGARAAVAIAYLGAYYVSCHLALGHTALWGSCMASRRSAWTAVRDAVVRDDPEVHDDLDSSFRLGPGRRTVLDRSWRVGVSARSSRGRRQRRRRMDRAWRTSRVNWAVAPPWERWRDRWR